MTSRAHSSYTGLLFVAVLFGASLLLGGAVAHLTDPIYVFGGSRCEAGPVVEACYGYPPSGLIVIGLVVGVAMLGGMRVLSGQTDSE